MDGYRAAKGQRGIPDWPDWCLLPMAAAYAVVSDDEGTDRVSLQRAADIPRLAALYAWRYTQGVYRFDPDLRAELTATPIIGDIPADVLYRLPEWCVYIETPGIDWQGRPLAGYFAHLEWDANTAREELRLLLDVAMGDGYALMPMAIHLGGSIEDGIRAALDETSRQSWRHKIPIDGHTLANLQTPPIGPLVSLVLYLCAEDADWPNGQRPQKPGPKRTRRHGEKLFPAAKIREWDVGQRIGPALRDAKTAANHQTDGAESGGRHRPRPHIRRAHWHTYWTGPKTAPDERRRVVKWLPPIAVNLDNTEKLPSVVRPVK